MEVLHLQQTAQAMLYLKLRDDGKNWSVKNRCAVTQNLKQKQPRRKSVEKWRNFRLNALRRL
jgi:hypothetical protein